MCRMALPKRFALGRLLIGCAAASVAAGGVCPDGFAKTYEITGCADPAHCGVYRIVAAHCEPGAHCPSKSDRTLCDRAPVYQLEGQPDGPVLHRCERAHSLALQPQHPPQSSLGTHPSRILLCGVYRYNYGDLTTRWFVGDAKTALSECDHQERYLSSALNDPAMGASSGPPTEYSATMVPTKGGDYQKDASRGWRDHSAAKRGKHLHVGEVRITAGERCPPSLEFRSKDGL